jgi:CxxC motif-containing protein (DUF1111 family)
MRPSLLSLLVLATSALLACSDETISPVDDPQIAEGIFARLGEPLPSATLEQLATFERGREVALRRLTPEAGLGPSFNVTFCGACHEKPVTGGSAARYRNFLLVRQELADGSQTNTGVNGVQDQFALGDPPYVPIETATNRIAQRNPIPFFGVGLLAEIDEAAILANADPDDADGDGISGRPNYDRGFVGRFGRKAQTVSLEGFIRGPLFNHAGITSDPLTNDRKNELPVPSGIADTFGEAQSGLGRAHQAQAAAPDEPTVDDDGVADPELPEQDLFDVVSFTMLMAAPAPDEPNEQTKRGAALFDEVGCDGCHVPTLRSTRGLIPAYSDLLLHDMGVMMADGVRMGEADGSEFRTQPLWGVAAVAPYLHDGRADTLDEAIRFHDGEGRASREAFESLDETARADVLAFLASLGGGEQRSEGLVPPDAEVPPAGAYGGPDAALTAAELALFARGRAVFDRDQFVSAGLGPRFNGDSCRACHFDPVVGGAGPADVDVIRQGIFDGSSVSPPAAGTMAHRHTVGDARPPVDPASNVFEARQTPTTLGLGLIDRIPDSVVLANADPDDENGDGVSGVAHVLPDGRLGRLGWKANVPSVAEFARDATFNELGLTLPPQAGLTFGATADSDEVADPEMSPADLDALVFFLGRLGPPPRSSESPTLEDAGRAVFIDIGCAACHVPSLDDDDGNPVALYSDLLLHDVAPEGAIGIPDGLATMREFRTPPLWGISRTAPYLHDGSAFSLEDAIAQHAAEGAASTAAYEGLGAEQRAALLAFLGSL